jgi:diacylglycerol O-acyltransferase / wax synthase
MQRMSGIDPMFIYSETPETSMEVAYTCVFDPKTAPDGYSFEAVRAHLSRRLPDLLPFRRRLMPVPMGLDHPRLVDDPEFDLDNHLHRVALPEPGEASGLSELTADIMSRRLDPDFPPWEMHIVEGLSEGMVGLIAKVHHSVIDGVSGSQLMATLLDPTAEPTEEPPLEASWLPPGTPSAARLMAEALPSMLSTPFRVIRAAREVGRMSFRLARHAATSGTAALTVPLGAPDEFSTPLGAGRAVSFAQFRMEDVRTLRDYFGVTVNDVVLAACSGALRSYFFAHDSENSSPLVAVVPVSIRNHSEHDTMGNRLSAMFVPLASDREQPMDRLRTIAASSSSAKAQERAVGYGDLASAISDALPPAILRPVLRLGAQIGAVRRLRPGNLVVSNVPGPTFPMFFAGMRLLSVYPIGPVVDGVALNITVQRYLDSLFVGLNACPSVVPDSAALARLVEEELGVLTKAAGNDSRLSHAKEATRVLNDPVADLRPLALRLAPEECESEMFPTGNRPVSFGVPCFV